jgi:hypothetical protein
MKKRQRNKMLTLFIAVVLLILVTSSVITQIFSKKFLTDIANAMETVLSAHANKKSNTSFTYDFSSNETLEEASSITNSTDPNWWLSSGGYFYMNNNIGETTQGALPTNDPWRIKYLRTNSVDTDNGYYPQNIFRLVSKNQWLNYQQQVYYQINKDNLSSSPRRNASNGLFLFNRYQDQDNLYYTGVRVDGTAVIKKKIHGTYYTMAYKQYFSGSPYHINTNPNLLPKNAWLGLRSIVTTNPDGTVGIKLFVDNGKTGNWILAVSATDDGKSYGGAVLYNYGHLGIRTDFMDVKFSDYEVKPL